MKTTRVLAVLLTLLLPVLALNPKDKGDAEQQIKNYLDQSRQASLRGDASFFETNLADDYQRVNPQGQSLTKAEFVDSIKSGDARFQSIDVKDVKVRVYGNTAVVNSSADVKGTNKGQDISGTYRTTRVFVNRGGKWQEVSFQATRVAGGS
ncbi:MAG: nuclear transport factor 2 family protein [Terriglobales bacterium]